MSRPKPKTVASVYGNDAADQLARWAIDALVYPPAHIDRLTRETRLPRRMVEDGRKILDDAGVDWLALKNGDTRSQRRAGT